MNVIVDGYNLLHAIGLADRSRSARSFERSRTRLLDWLADRIAKRDFTVRVVFDGPNNPLPGSAFSHRGIAVRFSHGQTADELIEELLHAAPRPAVMTVVSNDRQVQDSARHRGCRVLTCEEFVDMLIAEPVQDPAAPIREKAAEPATEAEMAAWLAAFSPAAEFPARPSP